MISPPFQGLRNQGEGCFSVSYPVTQQLALHISIVGGRTPTRVCCVCVCIQTTQQPSVYKRMGCALSREVQRVQTPVLNSLCKKWYPNEINRACHGPLARPAFCDPTWQLLPSLKGPGGVSHGIYIFLIIERDCLD